MTFFLYLRPEHFPFMGYSLRDAYCKFFPLLLKGRLEDFLMPHTFLDRVCFFFWHLVKCRVPGLHQSVDGGRYFPLHREASSGFSFLNSFRTSRWTHAFLQSESFSSIILTWGHFCYFPDEVMHKNIYSACLSSRFWLWSRISSCLDSWLAWSTGQWLESIPKHLVFSWLSELLCWVKLLCVLYVLCKWFTHFGMYPVRWFSVSLHF